MSKRAVLEQVTRSGKVVARIGVYEFGQTFTASCGHQIVAQDGYCKSDCELCGINVRVNNVNRMFFSPSDYERMERDHHRYGRSMRSSCPCSNCYGTCSRSRYEREQEFFTNVCISVETGRHHAYTRSMDETDEAGIAAYLARTPDAIDLGACTYTKSEEPPSSDLFFMLRERQRDPLVEHAAPRLGPSYEDTAELLASFKELCRGTEIIIPTAQQLDRHTEQRMLNYHDPMWIFPRKEGAQPRMVIHKNRLKGGEAGAHFVLDVNGNLLPAGEPLPPESQDTVDALALVYKHIGQSPVLKVPEGPWPVIHGTDPAAPINTGRMTLPAIKAPMAKLEAKDIVLPAAVLGVVGPPAPAKKLGDHCSKCGDTVKERMLFTGSYLGCKC